MASKDDIQHAAQAPVVETGKSGPGGETPGTQSLPPQGYSRREVTRMRSDRLQQLVEERAEQITFGLLDPSATKIDPDIARYYADILAVTNSHPERMYCWVETGKFNTQPQHVHHKQMQGYKFVNSEDLECPDTPRTPEGHRRIGTAVLMWIEIERWVEIRAHEHAAYLRQRGDMGNADRMIEAAHRHGAQVKVIENWGQLSPEARALAEQRFGQRQRSLQAARDNIDRELRQGTAHLNYGNQRQSHI